MDDQIPIEMPRPTYDRANPEHLRKLVEALGGTMRFEDYAEESGTRGRTEYRSWVCEIGPCTYSLVARKDRLEVPALESLGLGPIEDQDVDFRPVMTRATDEQLDRELTAQASEHILSLVIMGGIPRGSWVTDQKLKEAAVACALEVHRTNVDAIEKFAAENDEGTVGGDDAVKETCRRLVELLK